MPPVPLCRFDIIVTQNKEHNTFYFCPKAQLATLCAKIVFMKYHPKNIENIYQEFHLLTAKYANLIFRCNTLENNLNSDIAKEYLLYGVQRRLNILRTCIINVFECYPPEQEELISDKNRMFL